MSLLVLRLSSYQLSLPHLYVSLSKLGECTFSNLGVRGLILHSFYDYYFLYTCEHWLTIVVICECFAKLAKAAILQSKTISAIKSVHMPQQNSWWRS